MEINVLQFCVQERGMPVRLLSTLAQHQVCLTATPSHTYEARDASLRGHVVEGPAAVTRSRNKALSVIKGKKIKDIILFC